MFTLKGSDVHTTLCRTMTPLTKSELLKISYLMGQTQKQWVVCGTYEPDP